MEKSKIVLKAKWLIDGTGSPVKTSAEVIIENGFISSVTSDAFSRDHLNQSENVEIIDYGDATILPGLIDAHVHLTFNAASSHKEVNHWITTASGEQLYEIALNNALIALASGVTTLRECGSVGNSVFRLRDEIQEGEKTGPRILAAAAPITLSKNGHLRNCGGGVDNLDDIYSLVRKQLDMGVDLIKVMATGGMMTPDSNPHSPQFNFEELKVIVDLAHKRNKPVAAHVLSTSALGLCIDAGIDTIEHAMMADDEGRYGVKGYDAKMSKKLALSDSWVIHTAAGVQRILLPEKISNGNENEQLIDELYQIQKLIDLGAKVAIASDAGVRFTYFDKFYQTVLVAYMGLKITPEEAIQLVTSYAAKALRMDGQIGSIKKGLCADVLVVNGNLVKTLENLSNVKQVWISGKPIIQ